MWCEGQKARISSGKYSHYGIAVVATCIVRVLGQTGLAVHGDQGEQSYSEGPFAERASNPREIQRGNATAFLSGYQSSLEIRSGVLLNSDR